MYVRTYTDWPHFFEPLKICVMYVQNESINVRYVSEC